MLVIFLILPFVYSAAFFIVRLDNVRTYIVFMYTAFQYVNVEAKQNLPFILIYCIVKTNTQRQ